jgi:hypothetical protein
MRRPWQHLGMQAVGRDNAGGDLQPGHSLLTRAFSEKNGPIF